MPLIPTPGQVVRIARAQAEAVVALPGALLSLTRAVSSLDGTIREARETVARLQRIGERLESVLDEVEQPVKDLAPGLRRVGAVLDDPAVSDLPDTVRKVREDLLPLIATLRGGADVLDRFPGARSLLGGFGRPRTDAPGLRATLPPAPRPADPADPPPPDPT
jgi:ABC-type transporter Mla subunit MlaD